MILEVVTTGVVNLIKTYRKPSKMCLMLIDTDRKKHTTMLNTAMCGHMLEKFKGEFWEPCMEEGTGKESEHYIVVDEDFAVWYNTDLDESDEQTKEYMEDAVIGYAAVINLQDMTYWHRGNGIWNKIEYIRK